MSIRGYQPPPPIELAPRAERALVGNPDETEWCPTCLERTIPMRDGTCGFCDTPLGEGANEADGSPTVPLRTSRTGEQRDRRHNHGEPYSDEQILERIRQWATMTGRPPSKADWTPSRLRRLIASLQVKIDRHLATLATYERFDFPSETTVRDRFGSLNAALVQAGFPPRATGRQPVSATPMRAPKVGEKALQSYYVQVEAARLRGDRAQLKIALQRLAMSAIAEADRIDVG